MVSWSDCRFDRLTQINLSQYLLPSQYFLKNVILNFVSKNILFELPLNSPNRLSHIKLTCMQSNFVSFFKKLVFDYTLPRVKYFFGKNKYTIFSNVFFLYNYNYKKKHMYAFN